MNETNVQDSMGLKGEGGNDLEVGEIRFVCPRTLAYVYLRLSNGIFIFSLERLDSTWRLASILVEQRERL
jgi:hypothetical protein